MANLRIWNATCVTQNAGNHAMMTAVVAAWRRVNFRRLHIAPVRSMNRVRFTLVVMAFFSLTTVYALAEDKQQREHDKIMLQLQSQLRDATQPIYTQAIESLERLKKGAMADGDLPSANEIQKSIDQLNVAKTKDNLANRKFTFHRTIPGTPKLKFLRSGKIDGNDHPFETGWDVLDDGSLVIKGDDGQIMSTYKQVPTKNGLMRFQGTPKGGKLNVLSLQEVRK